MVDRAKSGSAEEPRRMGPSRMEPAEVRSQEASESGPSVTELRGVLEDYSETHRNRARGGLRALSGFDFEIRSYLADFMTTIARDSCTSQDYTDASNLFLERIGDYLRGSEFRPVVVQAKRTLTATIMAKAAVEFARIEQFLDHRGWGKRLAYEIVARSGDGELSWEHACTLTAFTRSSQDLQELFKEMQRGGRVLDPRIEEDPRRRLIAALWPEVDDPFSVERTAVDLCLGSSQNQALVDQLPIEISRIFTEAKTRRKEEGQLPGKLLQRADVRASGEQFTGKLIIGQIPKLSHLEEGQFLPRPQRVEEALAELDSLLVDRQGRSESMLDIFWIRGRSGSGKSVLLLQLAQHLVLQREEFVVWLDHFDDRLEDLLERWPNAGREMRSPGFVFIDDLYDFQSRKGLDLRNIARLIRTGEDVPWPVIVTCGPAQFEGALRYEGQEDTLDIRPWPLPLVDPREKERLKEWFETRRGRPARLGPAAAEDEGLMISLMAEMAVEGNLADFGRRFRHRLEEAKLDEALRLPLALNRLYIYPPAAWLGGEERNRLEALRQDRDFTVFSAEAAGEEFLRLTHPHLSNAIYRALEHRNIPTIVARDLGEAFERALESSLPVALEILTTVAGGHERLDEETADPGTLRERFCSVWKDVGQRGEMFEDGARTWAWAHWAVWAARDADISAGLGMEPLAEAINALERNQDHPQWSLIWRTLANAQLEERDLRNLGLEWIEKTAFDEDIPAGWSRMWDDLVATTKERSELDRLLSVGYCWLEGREGRREWSFVWEKLVGFGYALPDHLSLSELLKIGWDWLRWPGGHGRVDWGHVWQVLVAHRRRLPESVPSGELVQSGRSWVLEDWRQDLSQWPHIWGTLLDLEGESFPHEQWVELYELGQDWLLHNRRKQEPSWPYVWEKLAMAVESSPAESSGKVERKRLLRLGWEWLCGRYEQGISGWPRVWSKLVEDGSELPDEVDWDQLVEKGRQWTQTEHQGAGAHIQLVWRGLLHEDPDGTIAAAREWLQENELSLEATFVLQPLLEFRHLKKDDARDVIRAALNWLSSYGSAAEATFVLEPLLRRDDLIATQAEKAVQSGVRWLQKLPGHFNATHVIRPLFRRQELTDAQAKHGIDAGINWLERYGPILEAQFILRPLLVRADLSEPYARFLVDVALRWLDLHTERSAPQGVRSRRNSVLGRFLQSPQVKGSAARSVITTALEWLSSSDPIPEDTFILKPLLKREDLTDHEPKKAIERAIDWLRALPTHFEATHVIQPLLGRQELPEEQEEEGVKAGLAWLEHHGPVVEAQHILGPLLAPKRRGLGDQKAGLPINVALNWLKLHADDGPVRDARYFLGALLEREELTSEQADQAVTAALDWLAEYHTVPEARHVLVSLLKRLKSADRGDRTIRDAVRWAVGWLEADGGDTTDRTGDDESRVLAGALELADVQIHVPDEPSSPEERLLVFALDWSDGQTRKEYLHFVLKELLSRHGPRGGAARRVEILAQDWLHRFPEHESVDFVWTRLLRRDSLPDEEWSDVAAIAIADLGRRPYEWNREYLFERLRTRERLLPDGDREWLQRDEEEWQRWMQEANESRDA